jgi:CheY-like chemotaxis protein
MKIVLVEDSSGDATLISEFFSEEKNAPHIEWVTDGREALDYVFRQGKYAQAAKPDVILLDLALPRVSGYEALRQLKNQSPYSDIPVIVLTTSYNPVDQKNCMGLGADGYYSKPSSLQGYEDLVQTLIHSEFPRLTQFSARN